MAHQLYDHVYGQYANPAESAVRRETYGEDIGQSSWTTAAEWLHFADLLQLGEGNAVLEVGSGSGGPAVYLAEMRHCHVTGVDINQHGIRNARSLAAARQLAHRLRFETVDASQPLPFADASFDAVISNDAMCHIRDRLSVLRDWKRVLRPGGRIVFSDAMVVTGQLTNEELARRTSIGTYVIVPPGENERLIAAAGFTLLDTEDVTAAAGTIGERWLTARGRHRDALIAHEGEENFVGLQRFLETVHLLSVERRLSRFAYLARA
ncbi:MAG: class I SAM-dependent methyltransferase [Gemmatimonadota bacterium]